MPTLPTMVWECTRPATYVITCVHAVLGKGPFQLHLRVQVYPMDYHSLSQPASRQLLAMQLRRDLLENRSDSSESGGEGGREWSVAIMHSPPLLHVGYIVNIP